MIGLGLQKPSDSYVVARPPKEEDHCENRWSKRRWQAEQGQDMYSQDNQNNQVRPDLWRARREELGDHIMGLRDDEDYTEMAEY